ncbi:hypothetical protein JG687_00008990 [Phytophthora cactorum]|uniref:ZSWIM1/3 RNaseH-like domain-containing protein n=1 Tax=Phytophthora cactorum TaxID=29920 RepID=A0A8T1UG91_9STRA|nr:hypothetical protein PC112_g8385 [Phytophthora cactorum]KAG2847612.1 hypothetical protein PC111_g777 [Phytophthora cactorum]KAG4250377.1 hypothetical protein PC116_g2019 [Phytophthora cactorum]KAG6959113.1 hypothetical protein JG687_00008990 [Phytophthora cactorum]
MTRTNKTRRNPPGSLPDDAATGPGVKDDGSGEDSEVEATQVSVEAKTSALKQSKDLVNESVMAMLDAFGQTNTETKQKASFVADRIGLPISSQQVRILLKSRLGHGNVEQRLKVVLAEFVTDAGNACVLLQGEWDQTTDIVLQTKVQREIFSRATHLDLTGHIPARTSNSMSVRFEVAHLQKMRNFRTIQKLTTLFISAGSLIATVGTGRGVSVLDFLCLNQQKESLLTVLTWFKERNLSWPHLQSLVIDKDFTEWLL